MNEVHRRQALAERIHDVESKAQMLDPLVRARTQGFAWVNQTSTGFNAELRRREPIA
jgi:hypothetical protein